MFCKNSSVICLKRANFVKCGNLCNNNNKHEMVKKKNRNFLLLCEHLRDGRLSQAFTTITLPVRKRHLQCKFYIYIYCFILYSTHQPCISRLVRIFLTQNFHSLIRSKPHILRQLRRGPHTRTSHWYLGLIQLETGRQAVVTSVGIAGFSLQDKMLSDRCFRQYLEISIIQIVKNASVLALLYYALVSSYF